MDGHAQREEQLDGQPRHQPFPMVSEVCVELLLGHYNHADCWVWRRSGHHLRIGHLPHLHRDCGLHRLGLQRQLRGHTHQQHQGTGH